MFVDESGYAKLRVVPERDSSISDLRERTRDTHDSSDFVSCSSSIGTLIRRWPWVDDIWGSSASPACRKLSLDDTAVL
jgi:hypothetical protein